MNFRKLYGNGRNYDWVFFPHRSLFSVFYCFNGILSWLKFRCAAFVYAFTERAEMKICDSFVGSKTNAKEFFFRLYFIPWVDFSHFQFFTLLVHNHFLHTNTKKSTHIFDELCRLNLNALKNSIKIIPCKVLLCYVWCRSFHPCFLSNCNSLTNSWQIDQCKRCVCQWHHVKYAPIQLHSTLSRSIGLSMSTRVAKNNKKTSNQPTSTLKPAIEQTTFKKVDAVHNLCMFFSFLELKPGRKSIGNWLCASIYVCFGIVERVRVCLRVQSWCLLFSFGWKCVEMFKRYLKSRH